MFAVLKTGGKQYRVNPGDVLRVEKLDAASGETIQFNDVLMIGGDSPRVGTPLVDGAAVQAEVIDQVKGEKLVHFVKRRRKHGSQRKKGHRQQLTLVRVTDILPEGGAASGIRAAAGAGSAVGQPAATAAEAVGASSDAAPAAGQRPGNLLDAPRAGAADDLTRISGVGPKLEEKLHAAGIYHFDQIAAWGPDEVAYVDDLLAFKGRIERDDWIAQATRFAAEAEKEG